MQTIITKNNKFKLNEDSSRFYKEATLSEKLDCYAVYKLEGDITGYWVQLGLWHSVYTNINEATTAMHAIEATLQKIGYELEDSRTEYLQKQWELLKIVRGRLKKIN